MIPFFDLTRQYLHIKEELDTARNIVFKSGVFIQGEHVRLFEKKFAEYIGSKYCISCGNGTDALELVLQAWGLGPGDEVIVPAFTWISDAEAVKNIGAVPIFADVNESGLLDIEQVETNISSKTKAVIAVHLYGNCCDMHTLNQLAEKHQLLILEDAAHAHGADYQNKKAGTLGDAAIFSFYPTKNLGSYGDAGAVTTNDEVLASKIRLLANHGQPERDQHLLSGWNSRMDELQAAYLNVKLKYLDQWNSKRRGHAHAYSSAIREPVILNEFNPKGSCVYHQFIIKIKERARLTSLLDRHQIGWAIHYPKPIPAISPFYEEDWMTTYPLSYRLSEEVLSLPVFPELHKEEIDQIITVLNSYFES